MGLVYQEHLLDEAAVDEISTDVQAYLRENKAENRDIQRIRLTVEELLLNIMEHCGRTVRVSVGVGRQFGRQLVRLRYEWAPFDPTKNSDNPWSDDIMRSLGYAPSWSYRGKVNTVSLLLADRPKRSAVFYILLAVLAAVLLGFAGRFIPDALRQSLTETLLTPVADAFLGLMTTFSGLMIALTICSGMTGMGDSVATGRMGRTVLLRLLGLSFAICVATTFMILPFLRLNFSAPGQGEAFRMSRIGKLIFDILPSNIIDPFRTGNALQIIVIAMIVGFALIAVGERGSRIRGLIRESATLLQRTISMICALVPLFVFVMLLRQIWSGELGAFLSVLKSVLLAGASILAVAAVIWLLSSLRLKCSPVLLIKKILPAFLVALTTASSLSAMTLGMETCEKKLGVRSAIVSFVYPLGSVIYMPASVTFFAVLAFAGAEIYQIEISVTWIIMAVIVSTLLVIALPPIPGAGVLGFTVLFSTLGIPSEALVFATAANILFEFVDTGFNVMHLMLQVACESKSMGGPDRDVLLKE